MCSCPKCPHLTGEFKYFLHPHHDPWALDCGAIQTSLHHRDRLAWLYGAGVISPTGTLMLWGYGAMFISLHQGHSLARGYGGTRFHSVTYCKDCGYPQPTCGCECAMAALPGAIKLFLQKCRIRRWMNGGWNDSLPKMEWKTVIQVERRGRFQSQCHWPGLPGVWGIDH